MRQWLGVMAVIVTVGLSACTPKDANATPVVEAFLEDLTQQRFDDAAARTDNAGLSSELAQTWNGLQAEGLEAHVDHVDLRDTIATATYTLEWKLPKDRQLEYQTSMTLNRINDDWTIRWKAAALHPDLGVGQHLELRRVPAEKASVVSSDGAEILKPGTVERLLVDPSNIDVASTARSVVAQLRAVRAKDESVQVPDAGDLARKLREAQGPYSVTTLRQETAQLVRQGMTRIPGVSLHAEAAMVNVDPSFAPDLMQRITPLISDELVGANGWKISTVTADGVAMQDVVYHDATVAPAVNVSLDHQVQQAAEDAVRSRNDKQVMMVAVRPSTGQILAVAQNQLANKEGDLALNGLYPPGSTFKIVTASAGIDEEGLEPSSPVPCPATMNLFGRTVTNYNHFSLGTVPLQQAFARSCNTSFADISTRLAPGQLQDEAKRFGIGMDYTIPGVTTNTGSVPKGDTPLARTEAGYGQGEVLVTPFGMAMVSATAAAGKTPTPSLVSSHHTEVSGEAPQPAPATIEKLRALMGAVTQAGGTAAGMQQEGGTIFAKTGEAEFNGGSHAWFTGYRDDDIAFATLVAEGGGSEAAVAITDRFFLRLDELRSGRQ